MTNPVFFHTTSVANALFSALMGSFRRESLKEGFDRLFSRQWW